MARADWQLHQPPEELRRRYLAHGWWRDETFGRFLDGLLRANADREVRIWSETHPHRGPVRDVHDLARRLAGGLSARGFGPDDVIAFQLPNRVEALAVFYAVQLLGAVVVPIVHFYGPKEVGFILRQSGARAFLTADRFRTTDLLATVDTLPEQAPDVETVVVLGERPAGTLAFADLAAADPLPAPTPVDPDLPALVAYTSGTTADPKGVIHSHRTIAFESRQLAGNQSKRDGRPQLTGAPIGHGIGLLSGALVPLVNRVDLHMIDKWDPPAVLAAMLEADVAAGSGSTYFLTSLLDAPGLTQEHLAHMRFVGLGGSPVPVAVSERAEALGVQIVRGFGATEHPSITGATHDQPRAKRNETDGRPLLGNEIRLIDDDGREVAAGEAGEILSRGPERFLGYTDAALTATVLDGDGWYRTGDIGVLDAEGWLTITDRKSDIIIRGGENISAAEVEELLMTLPGVTEVAVVAAPDERMGEIGRAWFRMQPGATAPTLTAVREHLGTAGLARQKWPEDVRAVEDFPRTPSGKIKKAELRRRP
jgi:acyl-CoA synthetase (AMP-forming)/AMP-acid ligase II